MTDGSTDMAGKETHGFGAEVGRLLDLVVHSLYSEREIFLRELVANAADSVDRRRFEALTDPALALPDGARVRIVPDKAARTLLIADDGLGMSRQELIDNLGTIARSGTRAFGAALSDAKPEERPSLIGQFGVGFYSAFMVADRVTVTSRKAGAEPAFVWESEGAGAFTIGPAERATAGTDIVLHMKADAEEYLEPIRLETVVRKWADHITLPITIARDGKDEAANEGTALWRKSKSELTEQQYAAFYRHQGVMFDSPWATLHWRAEGTLEFFALLFVPGMKPFEPVEGERKSRIRLHVRRMFITDDAELLPPWLRFVQGVVDTEDLPLNVSREMLQTTPVLARIRKAVTNRVLSELRSRAKDAADYATFWSNFGAIMKEGVWEDAEHRKDVAGLLRFRTSAPPKIEGLAAGEGGDAGEGLDAGADAKAGGDGKAGGDAESIEATGWVGLADYVGRMQEGQDTIWFLAGDDAEALARSPQLEGFRARGIEVLLLPDPIDAFWPERLESFDGKTLRSVTQAGDHLDAKDAAAKAAAPDISNLLAVFRTALGDAVSDVRATYRLTDSAVVLASGAGPDLQMQRLLRRSGRLGPALPPVLEVNPSHPLIAALHARMEQADQPLSVEAAAEIAGTLLDLARVQEGELPRDPSAFARRITGLLAGRIEAV